MTQNVISEDKKMKLKTSSEGEVTVVRIEGNLDTQTSPEAQDELNRLMDEGSQKLLLDFCGFGLHQQLRVACASGSRKETGAGCRRNSYL